MHVYIYIRKISRNSESKRNVLERETSQYVYIYTHICINNCLYTHKRPDEKSQVDDRWYCHEHGQPAKLGDERYHATGERHDNDSEQTKYPYVMPLSAWRGGYIPRIGDCEQRPDYIGYEERHYCACATHCKGDRPKRPAEERSLCLCVLLCLCVQTVCVLRVFWV